MASRIGFGVYEKVFSVAYLILGTSAAFTLTSLPFFAVIYIFGFEEMWLFVSLSALTLFPSFSAVFGVFGSYVFHGDNAIISNYFRCWIHTFRRSIIIGTITIALLTVFVVDIAYLWQQQSGAIFVPILATGSVLIITVGIGSLTVNQLAPGNSLWVLFKATFYVTVRRFYLSALSWAGFAVVTLVIIQAPAIGLGVLVAPALFLFWSNIKYCLQATINSLSKTSLVA